VREVDVEAIYQIITYLKHYYQLAGKSSVFGSCIAAKLKEPRAPIQIRLDGITEDARSLSWAGKFEGCQETAVRVSGAPGGYTLSSLTAIFIALTLRIRS
jgi:hypothetical protein